VITPRQHQVSATAEKTLAGRDAELAELRDAAIRAAADGRGWVGLIGADRPELLCTICERETLLVGSACQGWLSPAAFMARPLAPMPIARTAGALARA
jgi:hypothetical protein